MAEYIYDYQNWGSRLVFTQRNALSIDEPDTYNKVNCTFNCCHFNVLLLLL